MLKCAYDEHFTVPTGQGRGFVNGIDSTDAGRSHDVHECSMSGLHSSYVERSFFSKHKVITYPKEVPTLDSMQFCKQPKTSCTFFFIAYLIAQANEKLSSDY